MVGRDQSGGAREDEDCCILSSEGWERLFIVSVGMLDWKVEECRSLLI